MDIDTLDLLNLAIPIAVWVTLFAVLLEIVIFYVRLATPARHRRFLAGDVYITVALIVLTAGLFFWRDVERSQPPHMTELVAHTDQAGVYILHFSDPVRCAGQFALQTQDGIQSKATASCQEDRTYSGMTFRFDPPLPVGAIVTKFSKTRGARIVSETGVELKSYDVPDFVVGSSSR